MTSDDRGLPTGWSSVEGTEYDFRQPRPIGATRLDSCFTDLERDEDGLARVELDDPDERGALGSGPTSAYGYLMLFTGDPLPDVSRRSLAVEPMTCAPNAFRSGEGAGPPGTRRVVHELVGDRARGRSLIGGQRVVRATHDGPRAGRLHLCSVLRRVNALRSASRQTASDGGNE